MNKTIKIIDLLNKIANKEEVPNKIEYCGIDYTWDKIGYLHYAGFGEREKSFLEGIRTDVVLNDEVEILEDTTDEIEELNYYTVISAVNGKFQENIDEEFGKHTKKINELVRAINKLNKQDTSKDTNRMSD